MCEKTKYKGPNTRIDKCLRILMENLSLVLTGRLEIVASCCGHDKYPMTIIVKNNKGQIFDLVSDTAIPRTRNFYRRDEEGYYYIPEINIK